MREIRQAVQETIRDADTRLTLLDVERRLSRYHRRDRSAIRSAIKELVHERELMYVSDFGRTFIETSLHKPIRITASIVIKPPNCTVIPGAGDIVVSLGVGTSFGSGQHPTTRLCLKGLEALLQKNAHPWVGRKSRALDIGTGSGVLIITAVKMGITLGIGLDVDPCSVSEAWANVECNGLSERITISSQAFEKSEETFDLILANLRLPTLKNYLPQMISRMEPGGRLLLSGVKSEECDGFVGQAQSVQLNRTWMAEERGWVALIFKKQAKKRGRGS